MRKLIVAFLLLNYIVALSQNNFPDVVIETTEGTIVVKLYDDTPLHSENFIKLVNEGYYNNQLFHRVIKNFMIQSGDPNSINSLPGEPLGKGGPGYLIPAEIISNHFHKKGALAAARQGDNVNPDRNSSGSQFYIVVGQVYTTDQLEQMIQRRMHKQFSSEEMAAYTIDGGSPHLDMQYTVFGEVVSGLDIVDKIAIVQTDERSRPINDIKIIKASIKK